METILEVESNILHAMSLLAAKDKVRSNLNGVWVESVLGKGMFLTATNSHIGGIYRASEDSPAESKSMFLPLKYIKMVPKHTQIKIVTTGDGNHSIQDGFMAITWLPPTVRTIDIFSKIPLECSNLPAQFNPKLLNVFCSVSDIIKNGSIRRERSDSPVLTHNGNGAAVVSITGLDFLGLIMPFRADPVALPGWAVK